MLIKITKEGDYIKMKGKIRMRKIIIMKTLWNK